MYIFCLLFDHATTDDNNIELNDATKTYSGKMARESKQVSTQWLVYCSWVTPTSASTCTGGH